MNTLPWSPRPVSIALFQFAMSSEPEENLARALEGIRQAAVRQADIVCLPELFRSPYFCVHERCERDYSEPLDGVVLKSLSAAAAAHNIAIVGGSLYERTPEGKLFNTSLVFSKDGSLAGTYRKGDTKHYLPRFPVPQILPSSCQ